MGLIFFGALLEPEDACSLFAFLGIIDPLHDQEGSSCQELRIRNAEGMAGPSGPGSGEALSRMTALVKELDEVIERMRRLLGWMGRL